MTLLPTVNGAARLLAGTTRPQDIDSATLGSGRATDPATDAEGLATATALAAPITGATLAVPGIVRHEGNDASFMVEYDGAATWNDANEIALFHGSELIFYGSGLDSVVYAHPSASVRLAVAVGITLSASALASAVFGLLRYVIEQLGVDGLTLDNSVTGATQIAVAAVGQDPSKKTSLSNAVGKTIEGATEAVPANDDKIGFSDTSDGGALKRADLSDMGAGLIPAGVIWDFAGATPPTGWLLCDGSVVSRTTYAALFGVIGTTYGAGDGSSTFNLPNLIGRVTAGAGSGALGNRALGSAAGAAETRLSYANMPRHNHPHSHEYQQRQRNSLQSRDTRGNIGLEAGGTTALQTDQDSTNAGNASPTPVSRVQPTTFVNKIIKT